MKAHFMDQIVDQSFILKCFLDQSPKSIVNIGRQSAAIGHCVRCERSQRLPAYLPTVSLRRSLSGSYCNGGATAVLPLTGQPDEP